MQRILALTLPAFNLLLGLCVAPADAQELHWRDFEEALAHADSSGRPVLVDVYAPWCGWCRKMKRAVYPSVALRGCLVRGFVLTRLNRDDTETMHRYRGVRHSSFRLAQILHAAAVPTVVLLAPDGQYLLHVAGFVEARELRPVLAYVASGAYRRESFAAFREGATPAACRPGPDGEASH